MKKVLFICALALAVLLIAACTKNTGGNATKTPTAQATTCAEFCPTQPHADCAGDWSISGEYPNCACSYTCVSTEPSPATETGEDTGTGVAPAVTAEEEVKSADGKYSLRVKGTKGYASKNDDGFFEYRRGDRVMLCGPEAPNVKEVIFDYRPVSPNQKERLIGYGHLFEGCYDFPLNQIGMSGDIIPTIDGKKLPDFKIPVNWVK